METIATLEDGVLVLPAAAIPDGTGRRFRVDPALAIAVFRSGDAYFAIDDRCPHQHASLCEGPFDGTVVSCPAHGWQVDVRTGRGVAQRFLRVRRFPVAVADGTLRVEVGPRP